MMILPSRLVSLIRLVTYKFLEVYSIPHKVRNFCAPDKPYRLLLSLFVTALVHPYQFRSIIATRFSLVQNHLEKDRIRLWCA